MQDAAVPADIQTAQQHVSLSARGCSCWWDQYHQRTVANECRCRVDVAPLVCRTWAISFNSSLGKQGEHSPQHLCWGHPCLLPLSDHTGAVKNALIGLPQYPLYLHSLCMYLSHCPGPSSATFRLHVFRGIDWHVFEDVNCYYFDIVHLRCSISWVGGYGGAVLNSHLLYSGHVLGQSFQPSLSSMLAAHHLIPYFGQRCVCPVACRRVRNRTLGDVGPCFVVTAVLAQTWSRLMMCALSESTSPSRFLGAGNTHGSEPCKL